MEAPTLVFIGFMGAGKTTGARAAAAALGVRAIDTDRALEERLGTSIQAYFASPSERAPREMCFSPPPGGAAFRGAREVSGAGVAGAPPRAVLPRGGRPVAPGPLAE